METKDNSNPTLRIGIRALIIIIILAILFILSLGIIKLVPKALDGISSIRSSFDTKSDTTKESLTVVTDKTVVNPNDSLSITWKHVASQHSDGYYAFNYQCPSAVVFEQIANNAAIACNTDYTIPASSINTTVTGVKTMTLKVAQNSQKVGTSTVAFSVKYINPTTKAPYITGSTAVTYVNNTAVNTEVTPTSTHTTTITSQPVKTTPVYVAPSVPRQADLQVRILSIGILDANNRFISRSQINPGERAAFQFQITNVGGAPTGNWIFQADLPSSDINQTHYTSPLQASLQSGGSVLYTLGFDQSASYGTQSVSVTADPNNAISEISKANNRATSAIFTTGTGYGTTGTTADLAISTTQAGYITSNGQFIQSSSIPYGSSAAVQLTVRNLGGSASGPWSFTSNVNSNGGYDSYNYGYTTNTGSNVYNSGTLASLAAGGSQTFTIRLDSLGRGTTSLNITLDPNYQSQDTNRVNNSATVQVYVN